MRRRTRILRSFGVSASSLALAVFSGSVARADECPEFGVSRAEQMEFCAEFLEILYGRFDTTQTRGQQDVGEWIQLMIESDPTIAEAYRSDPRRTLDLLERIEGVKTTN